MKKRFTTNLMAAIAMLVTSSAVQADLLDNGGFDTGDLTGWTIQTGDAMNGIPGVGTQAGTSSALLNAPADGVPDIRQVFGATAGTEYNMSGYMLTETALPATGATFGLVKIVFNDAVDGTGTDLLPASASLGVINAANPGIDSSPFLDSNSAVNTWQLTQAQGVAPTGTQSVIFLALNVDFGNGANHPMYFDSITASVVPEPGSIALLGLGALGLITRRRRS